MNTDTNNQAITALGEALKTISPSAAALIMAVAARAAWEMADTDRAISATEEAERLAITLVRTFPFWDTRRAVRVLGEFAEGACEYAYGAQF